MSIDPATGLITWTPADAQVGNRSVTVNIFDGTVTVSQTFTIRVMKPIPPNNKPVITTIPDRTMNVGDKFELQVKASDMDVKDVLTYKLEGQPNGMAISSSGLITWTPTENQAGIHTITVNVSDGKDYTTTHFRITVEAKGKTPSGGLSPMIIGAVAGGVIVAVIAVIGLLLLKRKAKPQSNIKIEPGSQSKPDGLQTKPETGEEKD
jgi:hypothetical protein